MTLDELIAELEKHDPDKVLPLGFHNPHSYRGDYMDLAFEPKANITVGFMLASARTARGTTFQGYKGGDYTMRGYTDCWLAEYGDVGETLGEHFVRLLLAQEAPR